MRTFDLVIKCHSLLRATFHQNSEIFLVRVLSGTEVPNLVSHCNVKYSGLLGIFCKKRLFPFVQFIRPLVVGCGSLEN